MEEFMNMDLTGIDIELPAEVDAMLDEFFDRIVEMTAITTEYLYGENPTDEEINSVLPILIMAYKKKVDNLFT